MKKPCLLLCLFIYISITYAQSKNDCKTTSTLKPRIVILTDIAPGDVEPDDMQSMIRLLVHADLFEIEALIASSGWNSSGRSYPISWMESLYKALDAYEKDLPNLMKRSNQNSFLSIDEEEKKQALGYWPSSNYLRKRVAQGSLNLGFKQIGESNTTEGSNLIIKLADESDDRPLWIAVWGGGNTLAQAIWQVKNQRSEDELKVFLNKLRVYTITDQDVPWDERHSNYPFSSHQWLRSEFEKELFFIWDESAWLSHNGIGASNWREYEKHIQNHGNLGNIYPKFKYGVEGDTPSFLYILPNGLNNPDLPGHVSWGGFFSQSIGKDQKTLCYTNHEGKTAEISKKYENYFYPATFNNFAARMDWAKSGIGNRNPIVSINNRDDLEILHLSPQINTQIILDASQSYDPDGDQLSYKWWLLPEASSYKGTVEIGNSNTPTASIKIPPEAIHKEIHIICEVNDHGTPSLTGYKRIILTPKEK